MATSKMIYIKSKVLNYYGLAGFRYEYNKLVTRGGDVFIDGDTVHPGSTTLRFKGSISNELITKQEYQKATGDYTCDIDESKKPAPPPCREVKNTKPIDVITLGISIGLILLLVISLCVN